jgi:hypothetical protein
MGFDLLAFMGALPAIALHALGELALALLALLVVAAFMIGLLRWLVPAGKTGDEALTSVLATLRGPWPLLVIFLLVVASAVYHRTKGPGGPPGHPRGTVLQAPNGKPWPDRTRYLDMVQAPDGGSGVIGLSHRSSAGRVYVKLCGAGQTICPGLRHAIIQRSGEFAFRGLPAGHYEIRMRYIDPPTVAGKSRTITVTAGSSEPSKLQIPAQPVLGSKDFIYGISGGEF